MKDEEIEGRLAGLQMRGPSMAMRARLLSGARDEWMRRIEARLAFGRFLRGWVATIAAAVLLCAGISWREEALSARYFASRSACEDSSEKVLRAVCAEVGLNHGYAARWAYVCRERRGAGEGLAPLWRDLMIQ